MSELPAARRLRERRERQAAAAAAGGLPGASRSGGDARPAPNTTDAPGGGVPLPAAGGGDAHALGSAAGARATTAGSAVRDRPDQAAINSLTDSNTEAGKLLAALYGRKKPTIAYPKPRTRPRRAEDTPAFVPGGGKPDVDPRKAPVAASDVAVPRPHVAPIELRYGRGVKPKECIDAAEEAAAATADRGMPPLGPQLGEAEKHKLATLFQYKGGKALPEEMTLAPLQGHVPLSLMTGKARRHKAGRDPGPVTRPPPPGRAASQTAALQQKFDDIVREVEERQAFLAELQALGSGKQHEGHIMQDIASRTAELDRLAAALDAAGGKG